MTRLTRFLTASSFAPKIATPELKRAAAAMKSANKNQGWQSYYWQPLKRFLEE